MFVLLLFYLVRTKREKAYELVLIEQVFIS